jgi:hypothetical protein
MNSQLEIKLAPTPETDGEWNRIACYDHPQFEQGIAEFARKLERERDEAREVLREIRDNEVNPEDEADKFLRDHVPSELSKVREQRDAVTLRLGNTQERMFDAEMQRDRLIKSVEPLKYWRDISECDCSNPLPQGGCLRCDLNRILKTTNPNEL